MDLCVNDPGHLIYSMRMLRLRSLLGVLGTDPAAMERALSAGADAIVVDLEDGVAAPEKADARLAAREFIVKHGRDAAIFVRINARTSPHFADDVTAVAVPGLAGVQLPKARDAADLGELDRALTAAETATGMHVGHICVIPTVESAVGVLNTFVLAGASPRVIGMMPAIGENGDLQQDLAYWTTPDEIGSLHARSHIVLATRAAGVAPIDGPYMNLGDDDGLVRSARLARSLGFQAKKVAQPAQVAVVNAIFDDGDAEQR
jgi:citrate lyase subunit beta / citryl-CoA lyase